MRLLRIAVLLPILLFSVSCHDIQDWADDPEGNFDALWTILDEHYCFFEEKGVNWDAVRRCYMNYAMDTPIYLQLSTHLITPNGGAIIHRITMSVWWNSITSISV